MVSKKLAVLCIVLLGTGIAFAQAGKTAVPINAEPSLRDAAAVPAQSVQVDVAVTDGVAVALPTAPTDGPADYGDQCPAGTICGQNPEMGGGTWQYSDTTFVNMPYGAGRVICEKFPPPQEPAVTTPIGAISWHTAYANAEDAPNHAGCNKPHKFEIKFYPHLTTPEGHPDVLNPKATYIVEPEVARKIGVLNWSAGGESDRWLLGAVLDPPFDPSLVGGKGWVSIASVQPQTMCYASIGPANEGNSKCWRYWMDNPTGGKSYDNDIHYCLGEYIPGACCDDWSGQCDENGNQFLCDLVESRFTTGTCADLDPLCGQIPGACCKADETCEENMLRQDCEDYPGAYWRGPNTTCDDCCWIPDCPGGAHVEAEACGDDTNGGCRADPPIFETIPENGVVCGTVWADGGDADEDWYEFTITQQANITIENVNSQLPVRVNMWFTEAHGPSQCDDLWYYVDTLYEPCVPGTFAMPDVWPKGSYWIRVIPEDADGPIVDLYPCDTANEYQFNLVTEYIVCPNPCADIPGAPFHYDEEPDYCTNPAPDTYNSGCDDASPPGPFLPISDDGWLYCAHSGNYDLPNVICRGDLNCDDQIDFADINPFVLILTNPAGWQAQYPDCPMDNGDINADSEINFGDINPFVALLSSGGGQPIPCSQDRDMVPDTDWYKFTVLGGNRSAAIFAYSEFPMAWELFQASAGCDEPALQHTEVIPCFSSSSRTFCLPEGDYWLRIVPEANVECGKEYALGLEEFITCDLCSVECPTPNVPEAEDCGDDTNGGCNGDPQVWESIACDTVVCGWQWADQGTRDTDWFELVLTAPKYLAFTLDTEVPVLTGWMDTNEANCGYLYGRWVNVDSCQSEPYSWYFVDQSQQPIQFPASTYWWLVLPETVDGEAIWYSYPCGRPAPFDLNTYWFSIECSDTPPQ